MTAPSSVPPEFMQTLRRDGINNEDVLSAIRTTPRHRFVQGHFRSRAYENRPLPIACGQTISQPTIVGIMTQALEVGPRHKVLEVGTGSGYQTAILSRLARRVYTIERHPDLMRDACLVFDELRLSNITAVVGDGSLGIAEQAPFDRIIVTAAAEDTPATLLAQLVTGGVMVVPVGQTDDIQRLIKVVMTEQGPDYQELEYVRFVPLLSGVSEARNG